MWRDDRNLAAPLKLPLDGIVLSVSSHASFESFCNTFFTPKEVNVLSLDMETGS